MPIVEYVQPLTDEDRRRHSHRHEKGRVLQFVVQYETRIQGRWYPVVRYDTAHGFAHRDLMHRDGRVEKELLHVKDFNEALLYSETDLKINWRKYKRRFRSEGMR